LRRYHKAVYTEPGHWDKLKALTGGLNSLNWQYSGHCLEHLKSRVIDIRELLLYIRGLELKIEDIFEYYINDLGEPERICFRIHYISGLDIILVVSREKRIITIYLNSRVDNHETLKRELYIQR
jgi:hypothetical protein